MGLNLVIPVLVSEVDLNIQAEMDTAMMDKTYLQVSMEMVWVSWILDRMGLENLDKI